MCCRMTIEPCIPDVARMVLRVGQFEARDGIDPEEAYGYQRLILDEGAAVHATITDKHLELSISPAISSDLQHHGKRRTAGVYFEIAARYAEKVNGIITQHSNVGSCITDGVRMRPLASYPEVPLQFDQVCIGFRREFMTLPWEEEDAPQPME